MIREDDQEVIKAISSDDPKRRSKSLQVLYDRCFPKIEVYIANHKGTSTDAKDIFQEAMVIFYDNLCLGNFRGDSKVDTYLFSICKNLWLQQLKKLKRHDTFLGEMTLIAEEPEEQHINRSLLNEVFGELKDECRKILVDFYYKKKSIKEIMRNTSMNSEQALKNKKGRCLKYLMRIVGEKKLDKNSFFDG